MQDRFKFRAWDETEKNMVYFEGIFYNKKPYTEGSSFPQYESCPHYHKLSDLMQCTGFNDKNGKLIYEGDIVKFNYDTDEIKAVVSWDDKDLVGFYLNTTDYFKDKYVTDYDFYKNDYEVIGNIHENPELLEG